MTEIHDLGEIDGPLLVFGGPYGNLQATEALLAKAGQLGLTSLSEALSSEPSADSAASAVCAAQRGCLKPTQDTFNADFLRSRSRIWRRSSTSVSGRFC